MPKQESEEPSKQLEVDIDDIVNIFQLTAPELFKTTKDANEFDMDRQNINFLLAEMGSELAGTLSKNDKSSELQISLFARDTGEFFYFATYGYELPCGGIEYRMTFTMSKSIEVEVDGEQRMHVEPFLVCNGTFTDNTIILKEMIVRLPNDENGIRTMHAKTEQEFYGAMQYANSFFVSMLQNKSPSFQKLTKLVQPAALAETEKKYEAMKLRTRYDANELADGVEEYGKPFMYHYDKMERLFQLDNHRVYSTIEESDCEKLVRDSKGLLEIAESAYVKHLNEGVTFTDRLPLIHQNSRNDSIVHIPYSHIDLCGVPRDYEIMMVTITIPDQSSAVANSTVSMPIAVIVAEVDYDTNTYTPLEAICKVDKEKSGMSYLQLTSPEGFLSAQCYAELAMECVILDNGPIHYRDLIPWLHVENFQRMIDRHNYLLIRQAAGLSSSLDELRQNGVPQFQKFEIATVKGTGFSLEDMPVPTTDRKLH